MTEQFSRTELLIGNDGISKLKNSYVAIFGLGGVGGYVLEALVRSGVGKFDLIDNDKVVLSNLNRQIIATHNTIGQYKVDVAKERALSINPDVNINVYKTFYLPSTSSEFDFSKYNYVVDAIDTVSGKIELIVNAKKLDIPIISSMGAGNKMNPEMLEVADIAKTSVCPLARVIRQELRKRNIKHLKVVYSKEFSVKQKSEALNNFTSDNNVKKRFPGSNAFVPSVAGLIIAAEVVKDIIQY